jgi:hypothetical protein
MSNPSQPDQQPEFEGRAAVRFRLEPVADVEAQAMRGRGPIALVPVDEADVEAHMGWAVATISSSATGRGRRGPRLPVDPVGDVEGHAVGADVTFRRMTITPADGGELIVLGHDTRREGQAIQNRVGYMPQKFGLYEDLTVGENLALHADLRGVVGEELSSSKIGPLDEG